MDKKILGLLGSKIKNVGQPSAEDVTNAVNTYLAENPVQAMTDEQVATSVNKGIADGSINVMSEVEDGSITESKLNTSIQTQRYRVKSTSTWCSTKLSFDNISVQAGAKLKLKFKIKAISDFENTITVYFNTNTTNNITVGTIPNTVKTNEYYDFSQELDITSNTIIKGVMCQIRSGSTKTIDAEIMSIKIYIDDKLQEISNSALTVSDTSENAIATLLTSEDLELVDCNMLIDNIIQLKEYSEYITSNVVNNLSDNSIDLSKIKETYPLDKTMANLYIKNLISSLKIFSEYPTSRNTKTTTNEEKIAQISYWFDTLENVKDTNNNNNVKITIKNDNGEEWTTKASGGLWNIKYNDISLYDDNDRLRAIITIKDWNNFDVAKFTSEYQIAEGTGTKENALIDKSCIIPIYKYAKKDYDLSMPDRIFSVASENANNRYALPFYLDYIQGDMNTYMDTDTSIKFESGSDVSYLAPRPDNKSMNLYIDNKTMKFASKKYNVKDKKVKLISTKQSDKIISPLKILIIGDSVTAGAITQQQYWSFAADYFAKEDLINNRDSQVMFLGNSNYRRTTVTYGEQSKDVFACACGVSSWSLKSWLNNDNDGSVNGFTYTDADGNVQFSFLKWLERYRNYDDEGNKLSIGDSNLGTLVTESNIDKIQCCTPNIILINSTHNGGTIEEHLKIAEIARTEIPGVKIIITDPMPLLGTWNVYDYVDNGEWVIDGLVEPNNRCQGGYFSDRDTKSRYWTKYEQYNDDVYIFPITWLTPTVEGWEWDSYKLGNSDKVIKRATTKPLPTSHPGTFTHSIWGYELYSLLKYIGLKDKDGLTSNEETITLDNTTISVALGSAATLVATSDNSDSIITYYSSDEEVATVDKDTGVITPIATGTCKIYINGSYLIKPVYCTVTVTE